MQDDTTHEDGSLRVTRRGTIAGLTSIGLAALVGGRAGGASDDSLGFDPRTVRWTAQDQAFHSVGVGNEDVPKRHKRHGSWVAATALNYLGAQWDEFGNPDPEMNEEGCWRHTFVMSSYAIGLRPVLWLSEGARRRLERSENTEHILPVPEATYRVPAVSSAHPERGDRHVRDILKERSPLFAEADKLVSDDTVHWTEVYNTETSINTESELEVTAVRDGSMDAVSVSARRDKDLYGFLNGERFTRSFFQNPNEGLSILNALSFGPVSSDQLAIQSRPTSKVRQAKAEAEDASQEFGASVGAYGTLLAAVEFGATLAGAGTIAAFAGYAAVPATIIGGFLALQELMDPPRDTIPMFQGFHQDNPAGPDVPATGQFVTFDICVAPDPDRSPSVSVRSRYRADVSPGGTGGSTLDARSVWEIDIPGRAPPSSGDATATDYSARLLSSEETELPSENERNHKIDMRAGDYVTGPPLPSPSVTVEGGTPIDRDKNRIVVESDDRIEADGNDTLLGGARITRHAWRLERGAGDEWTTVEERTGGNIYERPGAGIETFDFSARDPGRYRATLEVTDANGETARAHVRVTVKSGTDPSIDFLDAPATAVVGETVTISTKASPAPNLPEPPIEGPRFAYEWGVTLADPPEYLPSDGDTGYVPHLRPLDDATSNEWERSFDVPGTYRIVVEATDVFFGGTARASTTIEVIERRVEVTADPARPSPGESIEFGAELAVEADVESYHWTFGDGTSTDGPEAASVTHSYAEPGEYTVTVEIETAESGTLTGTTTVTVGETDGGESGDGEDGGESGDGEDGGESGDGEDGGEDDDVNAAPTVTLTTPAEEPVETGTVVEFVATAEDPEGDTLRYEWSGIEATGTVARRKFPVPGQYEIAVTVTDTADNTATDELDITVVPPNVLEG